MLPTTPSSAAGPIQITSASRAAGTSYEGLYNALRDLTIAIEDHYARTSVRIAHTGAAREALYPFTRRETTMECKNCGLPILYDAEVKHWYHSSLSPTSIWCEWDNSANTNKAEPTVPPPHSPTNEGL